MLHDMSTGQRKFTKFKKKNLVIREGKNGEFIEKSTDRLTKNHR